MAVQPTPKGADSGTKVGLLLNFSVSVIVLLVSIWVTAGFLARTKYKILEVKISTATTIIILINPQFCIFYFYLNLN